MSTRLSPSNYIVIGALLAIMLGIVGNAISCEPRPATPRTLRPAFYHTPVGDVYGVPVSH